MKDILNEKNFAEIFKSSEVKKNYFLSILCMIGVISTFTLWIPFLYLFIIGGFYTKIILIVIYIVQLFIQKNETLLNLSLSLNVSGYFKSYNILMEEKVVKNNSMICIHPHGVFCSGGGNIYFNEKLKNLNLNFIVSNAVRFLPLSGLIARLMGFEGCDNENMKRIMKEGKNILIIPGGYECAAITDYRSDQVYIKKRKGFIKYSLQYGYKLYPAYIFNENKLFYTFNIFKKFREFIVKFKIPAVFFIGNFLFFPKTDVDLTTIIGKPITLPKIESPTKEDVEKYHQIYMKSLIDLYDKYKTNFDCSNELKLL